MAILARWALMLLTLIGTSTTAYAHSKSITYSDWSISGETSIVVKNRVPFRLATILLKDAPGADVTSMTMSHVRNSLQVTQDGTACSTIGSPVRQDSVADFLVFELTWRCPSPVQSIEVTNDSFFDYAAGHLHFVRTKTEFTEETILSVNHRTTSLFTSDGSLNETAKSRSFFAIGLKHVLSGPDHLAFILGLIILSYSIRSLAITLSGFSIGHSLALALAIMDVVSIESGTVEALIALTIWLLGTAVILKKTETRPTRRSRWPLALATLMLIIGILLPNSLNIMFWFGAGLLTLSYLTVILKFENLSWPTLLLTPVILGFAHGFGFAGGLIEAFDGTTGIVLPLITFSFGVEAGQFTFAGAILGLAYLVRRSFKSREHIELVSAALGIMISFAGAFWLTERVILI